MDFPFRSGLSVHIILLHYHLKKEEALEQLRVGTLDFMACHLSHRNPFLPCLLVKLFKYNSHKVRRHSNTPRLFYKFLYAMQSSAGTTDSTRAIPTCPLTSATKYNDQYSMLECRENGNLSHLKHPLAAHAEIRNPYLTLRYAHKSS